MGRFRRGFGGTSGDRIHDACQPRGSPGSSLGKRRISFTFGGEWIVGGLQYRQSVILEGNGGTGTSTQGSFPRCPGDWFQGSGCSRETRVLGGRRVRGRGDMPSHFKLHGEQDRSRRGARKRGLA